MINTFLADSFLSSLVKGKRARQKSKGDMESPRKIPRLMSTVLDLRFPDLCDKNSVVFQLKIFDFRKLTIIGGTLNNSKEFVIHL